MENTHTAKRFTTLLGAVIALSFSITGNTYAAGGPDWDYAQCSDSNPSCDWHLIMDEHGEYPYENCGSGQRQSPVNLIANSVRNRDLEQINYGTSPVVVEDTGHTIEVRHANPNSNLGTIQVNGQTFRLLQFHFHTPSEHRLGVEFPMEIHFVHVTTDGTQTAVLGVFATYSASDNAVLDTILNHVPSTQSSHSTSFMLNPADLLPHSRQHVSLNGSFTTPPCTEGVKWMVFLHPIQAVSFWQLAEFENIMGQNNRPLQAPNGRRISVVNN